MVKFLELKNANIGPGPDEINQSLIPVELIKLRTLTYFQGENCFFLNYSDALKGITKTLVWMQIKELPMPFPVESTKELALMDAFVSKGRRKLELITFYMKKKGFNYPWDLKPERIKILAQELHNSIPQEYPFKENIELTVMNLTTIDGKIIVK